MKKNTILRAFALAVTLTAAPLAFSPQQGVATNSACAQTVKTPGTGTCCFQRNAICVTPTQNIPNAYFKSEGMC